MILRIFFISFFLCFSLFSMDPIDSQEKEILQKTLKIMIATEAEYLEKGWKEDNVLRLKLISILRNNGFNEPEASVILVDWRDREVDFKKFDAIFVSSTWNAVDFPDEFQKWLEVTENDGIKRFINSREVMAFSLDKKNYFEDLHKFLKEKNSAGRLIPTYFTDPQQSLTVKNLRKFLEDQGCSETNEIVVKPRVSADGKDMTRLVMNGKEEIDLQRNIDEALSKPKIQVSGGMIQPMIESVETGREVGEYQLLFLKGALSHASAKPPRFGGCASAERRFIKKENLPEGLHDFAEIIAQYFLEKGAVRIRVDMLMDQHQQPVLLEAEVIEPNSNTDAVYRKDLLNLKKEYLPYQDCPEYNKVMDYFATCVYEQAYKQAREARRFLN